MNVKLLNIVKQIAADYGEAVLADPQRLKAFFGDLAKDESKPLRIAFGRCIEAGAYSALKTAPDRNERAERKAAIAQRVRDEQGLDPLLCAEALDILEAALFADKKEPARCVSCGEELQPNWRACPFCGMAVNPAVAVAPSVAPAAPQPSLRNAHTTNAVAPAGMVLIQGGTFMMGSPASEPERNDDEVQHSVTVSSFYMGKHEVTQWEWREVMENNPSYFKGNDLPVEQVSWHDAVEYCNKRSQREGLTPAYTISGTNVTWHRNTNGYRLPTEAEWEYACRAGTTTPYHTGSSVDSAGWYGENSGGKTHLVGQKQPNAYGLYDMHGNVMEWCWDWYGKYPFVVQTDPAGPETGSDRVLRGGSWHSIARFIRSAVRNFTFSGNRFDLVGFRLARNAE
jgi:formylglycine-generating enzyme required for sulfatase activity